MKTQYVESLQEGDVVNDCFVATRKDLRDTQSGSKFLGMSFKDKTGEIGGVMWNNAASVAAMFEVGDVVNVRATVNSYQNRLQLRVDQVAPLKEGDYDPADLVFVPQDGDRVIKEFRAIMDTVQDPWLRPLVQALLADDAFMARFAQAAAGRKWHHAYPGGLIEHCYEMARIADTVCTLYPNLNRDLLITGIFVHDIGKLEEMTHDLMVDYTTIGKLVGHLQIGCHMVSDRLNAIPGFPEPLRIQLYHLILSHHGEKELGSPVVPKTVEAIVLHHIDNLDAQANAFTRVVKETRSKGQEWSDYITMIDRNIWVGDR